jgi:hypothetical protein
VPESVPVMINEPVKFTRHFETIRKQPDRSIIKLEWIEQVIGNPEKEIVQQDRRGHYWAPIQKAAGRFLRVVLLPDRCSCSRIVQMKSLDVCAFIVHVIAYAYNINDR